MSKIQNALKVIIHPKYLIIYLSGKNIIKMSDENYLKLKFKSIFGYDLDLDNPTTFNEKMQWLKIHDRKEIYTSMVDKYEAKKYISSVIGEEYIVPTIGVYDKFEDIDFSKLPKSFVIKTTNDSGGVYICKDNEKLDINKCKKKIKKSLKTNYYYYGREWPYKNIKPRIIVEPFLDNSNKELDDYKFMCFNGKFKLSFVCTNRFSKSGLNVTFFDKKWKKMPFERHYKKDKKNIPKPPKYKRMIELSEKLSQGLRFLRVDFYIIKEKIYVGELTFYPGSGFEEFSDIKYDRMIGDLLDLHEDR